MGDQFKRFRKNQSEAYNRKGRKDWRFGDWADDDDEDFNINQEDENEGNTGNHRD